MKKKLFGFLFLIFTSTFNAQNSSDKVESERLVKLFHSLEGTYQVQVVDSRDKTEIPLKIMDTIVAKRDNTKIVYFPLKNNVRVMVLPFSMINSKNFIPLERVANISSNKTK